VAAHDDDLLGAEPLGGDHAAQPDRAVADDRHRLAGGDPGDDRGMVASPHHVGERQQRRHQLVVVLADRQLEQRAVGVRNAQRLGLRAVDAGVAKEPDVDARGAEPLVAEGTRAVREREWHDHEVSGMDCADV